MLRAIAARPQGRAPIRAIHPIQFSGRNRMSGAADTPPTGAADSRVQAGHGPPGAPVDAVHDRVLGALCVLRNPLGAGAVHRRPVPRRQRNRRAVGQPDSTARTWRWSMPARSSAAISPTRSSATSARSCSGAVIMAVGLFMITLPSEQIFKFGLATIIAGNGLFKPNISTMVGKLYASPTNAAIPASPSSTWASMPARSSRRC